MTAPLRVLHLGFEDSGHARGGGWLVAHPRDQPEAGRRRHGRHRVHHPLPRLRGPRGGRRRLRPHRRRPERLAAVPAARLRARVPAAVRRHVRSSNPDLVVEDFFAPFSSMAAPLWTRPPDDRGGAVAAGPGEEHAVPPAAAPAAVLRRAQPPPARLGLRGHRGPLPCPQPDAAGRGDRQRRRPRRCSTKPQQAGATLSTSAGWSSPGRASTCCSTPGGGSPTGSTAGS